MGTTTQVVEYTYDVFNRRIAKAVNTTSPFSMVDAAIERYVYDDLNGVTSVDGGNVLLDFVDPDADGATEIHFQRRYLYGNAVDQILAQEDVTESVASADRVLWPLVDHLGKVRDLVKNDGTLGEHYKYDSFGQVTSGNTSVTRYLFTAREYDEATGLQYNRARWYDAEVGRWTAEDPLGFAAGDANIGRYVGNTATNASDPSGLILPPPYWPWPTAPQPPQSYVVHPTPFFPLTTTPPPQNISMNWVATLIAANVEAPTRSSLLGHNTTVVNAPPPPSFTQTTTVMSGTHVLVSPHMIPANMLVGPGGCGPCLGVTLIPPPSAPITAPMLFFHFSNVDAVVPTINQYAPIISQQPYTVVLNGFQAQTNPIDANINNTVLTNTIQLLSQLGAAQFQYVPTPSIGVSGSGQVFNVNPGTAPIINYDPNLDLALPRTAKAAPNPLP